MRFVVSKRAQRQIEKISAWWKANRLEAPSMFLDELEAAEARVRSDPEVGPIYATHRLGVVRRILLASTRQHLYYRYRANHDVLTVLSIWGASRERGPKL